MSHSGRSILDRGRDLSKTIGVSQVERYVDVYAFMCNRWQTLLGWTATYLARAFHARPLRAVTVNQLRENHCPCAGQASLSLPLSLPLYK